MRNFFTNLTARERLLVIVMLSLFALFVGMTLIVQPVWKFRQTAENAFRQEQITEQFVSQAIAGKDTNIQPSLAPSDLRRIITQSADQASLKWTNLSAGQSDNMLTITFANARSDDLYRWLVNLQKESNIVVEAARIIEQREGGVEASISFRADG